jgi:opacity protein-like surface antigen
MNLRILVLSFATIPAFAQPVIGHFVSFGVTGGAALTDAFSNQTVMGVDVDTHYFSGSKGYIVGPTIELHLPLRLSVEFDVLYRPLNLTGMQTIFAGPAFTTSVSSKLNSWEFPLLAKYRLPAHLITPFIEAGPSFRIVTNESFAGIQLSSTGFTAGVGVEGKLGPIRIAPVVRYTRWGADTDLNTSLLNPQSNLNQAEFLVGLTF